jgi:sec-independent protein translocase protein TatA
MGSLGPAELIIIAIIALLIFGPKKLPDLGSGLGKAIRDFTSAMSEPEPPAKDEKAKDEKAKDEKKEETVAKS